MMKSGAVSALVCAGLAGVAFGQSEAFVSDSSQSSAVGSNAVMIGAAGTLIGDYDAVSNPGGTQTRPGIFGGSGNQPVPLTVDAAAGSSFDLVPAASFVLSYDLGSLSAEVSGFDLDVLNGQSVVATLEATLGLTTFRTFDPDFIVPGIPVTLPLGEATIDGLSAVQTGAGVAGGLVPNGDGTFALAAVVPVELSFSGATGVGGPIGSTQSVNLPIAGTLDPTVSPTRVEVSVDLGSFDQTIPTDGLPPIEDVPFELPVLNGTAGLLLTLVIDSAGVSGSGAVSIVALGQGPAACNAADLAEPFGQLTFADITAFLGAFSASDGAADLAEPFGSFTFADITAFLSAFSAGCS
jgi:hypothetical protein